MALGDVAGERLDVGHRILAAKSDRDARPIRARRRLSGGGRRRLDRRRGPRSFGGRRNRGDRRDCGRDGLRLRLGGDRRLRGRQLDADRSLRKRWRLLGSARRAGRRDRWGPIGRRDTLRCARPAGRTLDAAGGRPCRRALRRLCEHRPDRRGRRTFGWRGRIGQIGIGRVHPCVERARVRLPFAFDFRGFGAAIEGEGVLTHFGLTAAFAGFASGNAALFDAERLGRRLPLLGPAFRIFAGSGLCDRLDRAAPPSGASRNSCDLSP